MEFFAGVAWCLSGWLAWKIAEKFDKPGTKITNWQMQLAAFIFGPILLVMAIMEYWKRKYRKAHPSVILGTRHKRDIFDIWDWLFGMK